MKTSGVGSAVGVSSGTGAVGVTSTEGIVGVAATLVELAEAVAVATGVVEAGGVEVPGSGVGVRVGRIMIGGVEVAVGEGGREVAVGVGERVAVGIGNVAVGTILGAKTKTGSMLAACEVEERSITITRPAAAPSRQTTLRTSSSPRRAAPAAEPFMTSER